MDQRVIRSPKVKYWIEVVQMVIDAISNEKPLLSILIIEAMKMLILAWDDVSTKTVQNCFKNVGYSGEEKYGNSDDLSSTLKNSIEQP